MKIFKVKLLHQKCFGSSIFSMWSSCLFTLLCVPLSSCTMFAVDVYNTASKPFFFSAWCNLTARLDEHKFPHHTCVQPHFITYIALMCHRLSTALRKSCHFHITCLWPDFHIREVRWWWSYRQEVSVSTCVSVKPLGVFKETSGISISFSKSNRVAFVPKPNKRTSAAL